MIGIIIYKLSMRLEVCHRGLRKIRRSGCQEVSVELKFSGNDANVMGIANPVSMHRRLTTGQHVARTAGRIKRFEDMFKRRFQWCSSKASESWLRLESSWIQQCVDEHEDCRCKLNASKPTRLLDELRSWRHSLPPSRRRDRVQWRLETRL